MVERAGALMENGDDCSGNQLAWSSCVRVGVAMTMGGRGRERTISAAGVAYLALQPHSELYWREIR